MTAVDEYLENQVLSASPHQLHLLVVDGAIRFARQGLAALKEQRWEAMGKTLNRARDCVTELIGGIDAHQGPEVAEHTKTLFLIVYRNFVIAELERNSKKLDDAIHLLHRHRETWVELGQKLQAGLSSGANPATIAPRQVVPEPHLITGRSWST
jgi:flagellar secretion chaperone FliS